MFSLSPAWRRRARLSMFTLLGLAGALGALWWALFALKPYEVSPAEWQARYTPPPLTAGALAVQLTPADAGPLGGHAFDLRWRSFDGELVEGRIVYPQDPAVATAPVPLVLALHALGRTHWRWWQGEFRGRPTLENTHRLAALALASGHAVLAIDARGHGARKTEGALPSELLRRLHWWGEREPYERMLVDTVRDWRVLLDWAVQQPAIDARRIGAMGYSMGAQAALLLAAADERVAAVAAVVPPALDAKVALVAPVLAVPRLQARRVWLLTADDDEYAPAAANAALFDALPVADRRHLRFAGGHVLPDGYVPALAGWFGWDAALPAAGAAQRP
jgi:dienelactone hydrolase